MTSLMNWGQTQLESYHFLQRWTAHSLIFFSITNWLSKYRQQQARDMHSLQTRRWLGICPGGGLRWLRGAYYYTPWQQLFPTSSGGLRRGQGVAPWNANAQTWSAFLLRLSGRSTFDLFSSQNLHQHLCSQNLRQHQQRYTLMFYFCCPLERQRLDLISVSSQALRLTQLHFRSFGQNFFL